MIRPTSKAVALKSYPVAVDADLVQDSAALFAPMAARPAEWVVAGTDGDLNVQCSKMTAPEIIFLKAGVPVYIEATKIFAALTTVTKLTVGY